ncbi:MAG TPA: MltA domain-containing protein [Rhizomicrobium sp.]|jgi:membrane-bound lytic murein transglycosylase A|nr:MltA domain-containing protein [Rhizomicrobium sp.]
MARRSRPLSWFLIVVCAALLALVGLFLWRAFRTSPPGAAKFALAPARFTDLPGWKDSDAQAALAAFSRSCDALDAKPAGSPMGGNGYAGTIGDWQAVCSKLPSAVSDSSARTFFTSNFVPLEVKASDGGVALFTGYYEPELSVSRTRHGRYQSPIYGLPVNLVMANLGDFRPEWRGERLAGCVDGHRLLPCPTRAGIDERGMPDAPVLFYADDPVLLFFLHIQGSGRVKLEDGTMLRVVYAGQNGHPYKPIGRTLIARGWMKREGMSMQAIRAWMQTHAAQARGVMETDPSYVFFKEEPLGDQNVGSAGSEGVPLTPGGSLAVDARIHPLGIPIYVAATRPDVDPNRPARAFDQLLVAQDTGGAIRGPARGDVYWGFGKDAESVAGRMKADGRLFVLLPKAVAARLHNHFGQPVS